MYDKGRAELDGPAQKRSGACVVDNKRNSESIGYFGDSRKVGDVSAGVADAFAKNSFRSVIDRVPDRRQIFEIDKPGFPAKPPDRVRELGYGSAVKSRRDDDVCHRVTSGETRP